MSIGHDFDPNKRRPEHVVVPPEDIEQIDPNLEPVESPFPLPREPVEDDPNFGEKRLSLEPAPPMETHEKSRKRKWGAAVVALTLTAVALLGYNKFTESGKEDLPSVETTLDSPLLMNGRVQTLGEAQNEYKISRAEIPSPSSAKNRLPGLLQGATNANASELARQHLYGGDKQKQKAHNKAFVPEFMKAMGVDPNSEAGKLAIEFSQDNVEEDTLAQFRLQGNELVASRIQEQSAGMGETKETKTFTVSGEPRLIGDYWDYSGMKLQKK